MKLVYFGKSFKTLIKGRKNFALASVSMMDTINLDDINKDQIDKVADAITNVIGRLKSGDVEECQNLSIEDLEAVMIQLFIEEIGEEFFTSEESESECGFDSPSFICRCNA